VLQALYQGTPQGSVRKAARRLLSAYSWREPIHEALFQIVMSVACDSPEFLREQLLACLTRRGFPDVLCEWLFESQSLHKEDAEVLMRQLMSGTG